MKVNKDIIKINLKQDSFYFQIKLKLAIIIAVLILIYPLEYNVSTYAVVETWNSAC